MVGHTGAMSANCDYVGQDYISRWEIKHTAALHNPLRPSDILFPIGNSSLPEPYPSTTERRLTSELPTMSFPPPRPSLHASTSLSMDAAIKLEVPLRTGRGYWSQVWVARLSPTITTQPTSPCPQVILKLFQESLFPHPSKLQETEYDEWSAHMQSAREAWAYRRLLPLQGTLLPRSYGFYDFLLPCGETVCGHLMEFIDGTRIERDYNAMLDGSWYSTEAHERRSRWMKYLFDAIMTFRRYDVHHGDIFQRNVLQLRSNPDCFVFLDFGLASPLDAVKAHTQTDLFGLLRLLRELHDCRDVHSFFVRQCQEHPWLFEEWGGPPGWKDLQERANFYERQGEEYVEQLRQRNLTHVPTATDSDESGSS